MCMLPIRPSNQKGVERVPGRVPRHLPAHEVAVPGALFVRALAKHSEGDVARMNIGQLADLRCNPGAPLALLRRRVAGVPHEIVDNEHPASLKRVQQCHRATFANGWCGTIHLDHRQPSAGSCNGVTLVRVRLLPNPQCVQLGLKGGPVDYVRGSKFISHEVCRSLRQRLGRCLFSCGPLDLTVSGDMLRYRLSFPRGGEIKVHHDLLVAMLRAHGEALARLLRENSRCSKAAKWSPFFSWPSPLRRAFARRLLEGR
jgi:hypothetical protein